MKNVLTPHILVLAALAGWLNREQQKVLEFLREENRVLRAQLGDRRLRLTNDDRRSLAVMGHDIGRRLLSEFASLVTPDTILRWHRKLIAQKWTNRAGTGRPGVMKAIENLTVRMASDNPSWGYRRIQGALRNVGHHVAHNTVKRILETHGIEPAPKRKVSTNWSQFLKTHWSTLAATDFFSTEVWTTRGLVTIYTLFVIRLETRRISIVGSTSNPDHFFVKQAALDLVGFEDSVLADATHFILDRDTKFTEEFRSMLREGGVEPVVLPARSPNLNAHAERFVRTIKSECLSKMIFFGQRSLDRAIREFVEHHHSERNHQGLGNELITKPTMPVEGEVLRDRRCACRCEMRSSWRSQSTGPVRSPIHSRSSAATDAGSSLRSGRSPLVVRSQSMSPSRSLASRAESARVRAHAPDRKSLRLTSDRRRTSVGRASIGVS